MPQSYQEHNGDNSTHTFTIAFGSGTTKYLKREHIKLYYGRDRVAGTQTNTLTLNTDYVYISDLVIKLIGSTLNTGVTVGDPYPLASGRKLTIERDTPQDTLLVPWADGSNLTKEALETSNLQVLFGQQEEADTGLLNSAKAVAAETASTTATNDVAVLTANYFKRDGTLPMTGNLQLGTNKITGVGDPTSAQDAVTKAYLERTGSIASAQIVDGTIVDGDVNASAAISGSKLQASSGSNAGSMSSAHYTKLENVESNSKDDQTGAEIKAAYEAESNTNAYTDAEKTKLAGCDVGAKDDQTAAEIKSLYESNSNTNAITDTEKTNIGTITNKQPLDSELTTLSGMQSATASKLASGTALTSDIADLNQIDGLTKQTTISDSDASFPTSGAVVDYVAAQIAPIGGLEVVATEVAFPNTQPASGVVISISDAGGVVINGSGVSTTGRTVGGATITINGFPSSLQGETLVAGVGLMVSSTGSSQTYNYHKILGKEDDIKQLSDDINDFNARYRVGSSNPSSALDAGDLFFNTSTSKLLVYNATNTAWEEAQSIGNFYISTLSPAFNGSLQDFTITNAPTNAEQILLSINGVIQKPNAGSSTPSEGFALSGSTVKLGAVPASTDTYFAVVIGSTVNIGTPSNNTVSTAILQNGSVTNEKVNASAAIAGSKLADDSIAEVKLDVHNAPSGTDKFLAYTSNGMEWAVPTDTNTQLSFSNDANNRVVTGDGSGGLNGEANLTFDGTVLEITNATPKIKLIDSDATGTPEAMIDGSGGDLYIEVDKDDEKGSSRFGIKVDGSEKLRINSSGFIAHHDSNIVTNGFGYHGWSGKTQILDSQGLAVFRADDAWGGSIQLASSRGNYASPSASLAGDRVGGIYFCAHDGTDLNNYTAAIESYVTGTVASNATPGYLAFSTANNGTNQLTQRFRIDSNGYVGIKLTDPDQYYAKDLVVQAIAQGGITIKSPNTTDTNYLMFADGTSGNERYRGYIGYAHNTGSDNGEHMQFAASGGTGLMRLYTDGLALGGETATANRLNVYEEGTWTPTDTSGAGLTFSNVNGWYVKVGSLVTMGARFTYPTTSDTSQNKIGSFPFFAGTNVFSVGSVTVGTVQNPMGNQGSWAGLMQDGRLRTENASIPYNDDLSGSTVYLSISFTTA